MRSHRSFRSPRCALALAAAAVLTTVTHAATAGAAAPPAPPATGGALAVWGSLSGVPASVARSVTGRGVVDIAGNDSVLVALTAEGTVEAWGTLGYGLQEIPRSLRGRTVTDIAAGATHLLALTSDGHVTGWGDDDTGQTDPPATLDDATAVAAGNDFSLALTAAGTVVAWGADDLGQTDVPAALSGRTVVAIAAGATHALALTADGAVTAWGDDTDGATDVPASLGGRTVTAITAGGERGSGDHNVVLTSDGTLTAWGHDSEGEAEIPQSLQGKVVTEVSAGAHHNLAITADGAITAWGRRYTSTKVPQAVQSRTALQVAAGFNDSLAILAPPQRVEVRPAGLSRPAGTDQAFRAYGVAADGTTLGNVTAETSFTISPEPGGTGSRRGAVCEATRCTATIPGRYRITATDVGATSDAAIRFTNPTVSWVSVEEGTDYLRLYRGTSRKVHATAHYLNGSTADVTTNATWTVTNPAAATVTDFGLVTGDRAGGGSLSATYFGQRGLGSFGVSAPLVAVTGVTPRRASAGDVVTIHGRHLDLVGAVHFDGADLIQVERSATAIVVRVPDDVRSGPFRLTTDRGFLETATLTVA